MTKKDYCCVLLYATVAVAVGFADLRMRAHPAHVVTSYIPGVVANTDGAPGVYRVLAPYLVFDLARWSGASLLAVWYVTRLLWIFLALLAVHAYLRTWFPPEAALGGALMTAATLPLTFTNSWPNPDHIPELALFTLGAMAIARKTELWFAVVLAIATLNRETAAFLVLLYAVAYPLTRRRAVYTVGFAAEWLAIYTALRVVRGLQHYEYWQLDRNLQFLRLLPPTYDPYSRAYAYFGLILFGPMLYLALRSATAPVFSRRALVVVPSLGVVALLFSGIIESRIFTPIYAIVLPGVMSCFFVPITRLGEQPS